MTTKRRPYLQDMSGSWWWQLGFYRAYMIREGTAIMQIWFSGELIFGLFYPHNFISFLQNPIIVMLNILTLAAALLHSITWFNLAPKAVRIIVANKPLSTTILVIGLNSLMVLCTVAFIIFALW